MANQRHVNVLLREGVVIWNRWRTFEPDIYPDLSGADLHGENLRGANLRGANLSHSILYEADLSGADLTEADLTNASLGRALLLGTNLTSAILSRAHLSNADLSGAILSGARFPGADLTQAILPNMDLRSADLSRAYVSYANLSQADLSFATLVEANLVKTNLAKAILIGADLSEAICVGTDISGADITGCTIYGISAWDLITTDTVQADLRITPTSGGPAVTVDNLEMAQFIYLMLHNDNITRIINTLNEKIVLILGRFTPERKAVLEALRDALRQHKPPYVPVIFDFKSPKDHRFTETVTLLARMARFIIADLTDPASIPQELQAIVPHVHIPVQPIIAASNKPYAMFADFQDFPWMLDVYHYADLDTLLAAIEDKIIAPAEDKVYELRVLRFLDVEDELLQR